MCFLLIHPCAFCLFASSTIAALHAARTTLFVNSTHPSRWPRLRAVKGRPTSRALPKRPWPRKRKRKRATTNCEPKKRQRMKPHGSGSRRLPALRSSTIWCQGNQCRRIWCAGFPGMKLCRCRPTASTCSIGSFLGEGSNFGCIGDHPFLRSYCV